MAYPFTQGALQRVTVLMMIAAGLTGPGQVWGQVYEEDFDETLDEFQFLEKEDETYLPNTGKVSFEAGVDFTNAYFFRGAVQEDQGFIGQPWAEMKIDLYDGSGVLTDFTLTFGIWNSIQDRATGHNRQNSLGSWYESDLYFTFGIGLGEAWGLGVTYIAYSSPNDAFRTIHEVMFKIAFNDHASWEAAGVKAPGFTGFQPTLTFAIEAENTAFGTDQGSYFEIGVNPGFTTFAEFGGKPVSLSFPMALGISLDNYYNDGTGDDNFGFIDAGIVATWPISFISPDYGAWEVAAGIHFLFLTSGNLEAANSGEDFELIGTFGFSMAY